MNTLYASAAVISIERLVKNKAEMMCYPVLDINKFVYQIDLMIMRYQRLLELLQPYGAGKISVRFIKRGERGDYGGLHPHIIKWSKSDKTGKFYYQFIPVEKVGYFTRVQSIFGELTKDVKNVLEKIVWLLKYRSKTLNRYRLFYRAHKLMTESASKNYAESVADIEMLEQSLPAKASKVLTKLNDIGKRDRDFNDMRKQNARGK